MLGEPDAGEIVDPSARVMLRRLLHNLGQRVDRAMQAETQMLQGFASPNTDRAAQTLMLALRNQMALDAMNPSGSSDFKLEPLDVMEQRLNKALLGDDA